MSTVARALESLADDEARARVIAWASSRFLNVPISHSREPDVATPSIEEPRSLGQLLDRAQPTARPDRVLLIAHWFHARGEADFTAQAVNDELKNLGDAAPNITDLLSSILARRPAPMRQTRRVGSGRQARKRFALTEAGRTVVQTMLSGNRS
jgi:hypothetical protein